MREIVPKNTSRFPLNIRSAEAIGNPARFCKSVQKLDATRNQYIPG